MTGRRAMRGPDERLSRALQFIPGHVGGRVASAQPIRRRGGTLRQASVGAGGMPATAPEWMASGWDGAYMPDTTTFTSVDFSSLTEFLTVPVAGMHVVAIAHGVGCTFTAPTGWTQKASVAVGTYLKTRVFTIVLPSASWAGIDLDFTTDATRTGIYDPPQSSEVELMSFSPTTATLQVATATDAASATHYVANCDPSWLSPWQSWSMLGAPVTVGFEAFSYDNQVSLSFNSVDPTTGPADYRHRMRSNGPVLGSGYGPLASGAQLSEASSTAVDWISLALGWA